MIKIIEKIFWNLDRFTRNMPEIVQIFLKIVVGFLIAVMVMLCLFVLYGIFTIVGGVPPSVFEFLRFFILLLMPMFFFGALVYIAYEGKGKKSSLTDMVLGWGVFSLIPISIFFYMISGFLFCGTDYFSEDDCSFGYFYFLKDKNILIAIRALFWSIIITVLTILVARGIKRWKIKNKSRSK